jgi:hypothetical protein
MSYAELIVYFQKYRREEISHRELQCAIALWQFSGARIH